VIGAGLLTKGTFLLAGPAAALIVSMVERRNGPRRMAAAVAGFCLIWSAIGCFKYADNLVRVGHPLVTNLDVDSMFKREQSGTWKGWRTVYDIDVLKLIRRPVLQTNNTFSYPLLLYGTFWYPHVPGESSFDGNVSGYAWVGSAIYALAIIPTLIFFIGMVRATVITCAQVFDRDPPSSGLPAATALVLLLANLAVVIAAGVKYDVWSCFQSRLCFPGLAAGLVLFSLGMEKIACFRWAHRVANVVCWLAVAAALLYFCIEIPLSYGLLPRTASALQ
jgi:hypothetical protein